MKKNILSILLLFALAVGVWFGFSGNYKTYYGLFDDTRGLQGSSPVYLKGVKIGKVDQMQLARHARIKVRLRIDADIALPKNTTATIVSGASNGSKAIKLTLGASGETLPEDSWLQTEYDSSLIENFDTRFTPVMHQSKTLLHGADSALKSFNQIIRSGWGNQTREEIARFHKVTGNLATGSKDINRHIMDFTTFLRSADATVQNPQKTNAQINRILTDAEEKTDSLAHPAISERLAQLNTAVSDLSDKLSSIIDTTDPNTLQKLSSTLDTLAQSVKNYRQDPPPLIQVFGKKK